MVVTYDLHTRGARRPRHAMTSMIRIGLRTTRTKAVGGRKQVHKKQGLRIRDPFSEASTSSPTKRPQTRMSARVDDSINVADREVVRRYMDNIDTAIFDCDGVIWRGDNVIDGAARALEGLLNQGKRVVSNSSGDFIRYI